MLSTRPNDTNTICLYFDVVRLTCFVRNLVECLFCSSGIFHTLHNISVLVLLFVVRARVASCVIFGPVCLSCMVWRHGIFPNTSSASPIPTQLVIRRTRLSTVGDRAFPVAESRLWNRLPPDVTSAPTLTVFRDRLKTYLFSRSILTVSVSSAIHRVTACIVVV